MQFLYVFNKKALGIFLNMQNIEKALSRKIITITRRKRESQA